MCSTREPFFRVSTQSSWNVRSRIFWDEHACRTRLTKERLGLGVAIFLHLRGRNQLRPDGSRTTGHLSDSDYFVRSCCGGGSVGPRSVKYSVAGFAVFLLD